MPDEKMKEAIDLMDYRSMLSLWRNAPAGHPMFRGEIGRYFSKILDKKRKEVGENAHIKASKDIGFD